MNMIRKTITLLLVLMLVLAAGCSGRDSSPGTAPDDEQSYADLIFDTSLVHTVDVSLSEEDRADQLADPTSKTKYHADVVIDGEEIEDVSFHTKGNSSLFFVVDAGRDKFSYEINFGKYTKGQTFHGLDKLNLQNNFSDATSMKEYMAYWLFHRMGVTAPLSSFVWLTVNGEEQGLYTALENMEDSFLERTLDGKGTIYKPEAGDMALNDEEMERLKSGSSAAHDSSGGADLKYIDDEESSYPEIFENAETDEDEETRARVIRSLKALSERKDLDKYLDTGAVINYFAVHDYLVSYDSYTGPMLHNYCLYENGGRLAMLPWDYDIAYGAFPADAIMGSEVDSNAVINAGIDSPLGIIADEDRPMWYWILCDESYLSEYHDKLAELADVVESGEFEEEAGRVYDLILPYVEKDPKTVFKADRFRTAFDTLISFTELRTESVRRQLSGQLASRSEMQAEGDRVDASGIIIKDMGTVEDLKTEE